MTACAPFPFPRVSDGRQPSWRLPDVPRALSVSRRPDANEPAPHTPPSFATVLDRSAGAGFRVRKVGHERLLRRTLAERIALVL